MRCALVLSVLVAGCVPGEVDLRGQACPCAPGWWCDRARDECVEGEQPADGGLDAGAEGPDAASDAAPPLRDAAPDGPVDAPPDAGPDAGPDPTGCDDVHAGAIFCDGIEDGALAAWTSAFRVDGTIGQTTARAHRGGGALRAQTARGGAYAGVRSTSPGGVTAGHLHLRAFVYVPGSLSLTGSVSMMQLGHDAAPFQHVGISLEPPSRSAVFLSTDTGSRWMGGGELPRDRWVCVEVHVEASQTDGRVEYWVDGVLQATLSGVDTVPARGYERFVVGIPYSAAEQGPSEVCFDEVVYDVAPIGCD